MVELLRTSMVHQAHTTRTLLESFGIQATVRGEATVGMGVPIGVWVSEADAERARDILREDQDDQDDSDRTDESAAPS
ncbi:MAG: DUF2007 domain-containing protein [Gemmatimonadales bacterium]